MHNSPPYIHPKFEVHRGLHYSDQKVLLKSQTLPIQIPPCEEKYFKAAFIMDFLHAVEALEQLLGGAGRFNTELLIDFLDFLSGVKKSSLGKSFKFGINS